MPNFKTHVTVGGASGVATALYRSRSQDPLHQLAEAIGGVIGGCAGGVVPDVIEPATSSWHRSMFHSWTALTAVSTGMTILDEWEEGCRRHADYHRRARESAGPHPLLVLLHLLAEAFWRIMAGALGGFGAGYVSHLVMDSFMPRSLPVLG